MSQSNFIFRVSASAAPSASFSRPVPSPKKAVKIPLMLQVVEDACPACGSTQVVRQDVCSLTGKLDSSCVECSCTWTDEV